jgi:hypothetical protein
VRQLFYRGLGQQVACRLLGPNEQCFAAVLVGVRVEAVDGDEEGAVVGSQGGHSSVDAGAPEEGLEVDWAVC